MNIPLVDLKAQYLTIKDEIDGAIDRVLESARFILGQEVTAFEHEFADYCGVKHAVGTSSGTSALLTTLSALGVGPGDEVLTTPMTFIATTSEVSLLGARPIFSDIESRSFTLDINKAREKIETEYYFDDQLKLLVHRLTQRRLKAIIPVHLYGQMTDMSPLLELARQYNLTIIEDAAQAHGAEYRSQDGRWRRAGSLGAAGCFSFYPGKNLGAYGDAGAVVTDDGEMAQYMHRFVHHGRTDKHRHEFEGGNYRLDALQAAVLRVKLRYLDQWTQARRRIASQYDELLRDLPDIKLPEQMDYGRHVYHLFTIRTPRRDEVYEKLIENGIGVGIHYPIPLHLQPAYQHFSYKEGDFPVSEACAGEVLSLPIYPEMTEAQVGSVVRQIKKFL